MSTISLPATALASCESIDWGIVLSQDVQYTITGVSQITSYPDRRWYTQLRINPQFGSTLRTWSLALDQLADRSNVVALGPPQYEGPSTSYAGASPLVKGANQLGITLLVDGLTPSAAILLAGDYFSFDTTSPQGNTNRQLNRVTANATANGSGEVTLALAEPIRQAPADNAAVNITTPTAFFMVTSPRSSLNYQIGKFSSFVLDAEERIFP